MDAKTLEILLKVLSGELGSESSSKFWGKRNGVRY